MEQQITYPSAPLPCFACGKELQPVFKNHEEPDAVLQADDACCFRTSGQYGSTVFDELGGDQLHINICDDCIVLHADRIWFAHVVRYRSDVKVVPWAETEDFQHIKNHRDTRR